MMKWTMHSSYSRNYSLFVSLSGNSSETSDESCGLIIQVHNHLRAFRPGYPRVKVVSFEFFWYSIGQMAYTFVRCVFRLFCFEHSAIHLETFNRKNQNNPMLVHPWSHSWESYLMLHARAWVNFKSMFCFSHRPTCHPPDTALKEA